MGGWRGVGGWGGGGGGGGEDLWRAEVRTERWSVGAML